MIRLSLLLFAFLICLSGTFAQNVVFKGRVVDAETTRPLSDASVVLTGTGKLASTNMDGEFQIADLRPGFYNVVVTRTGYFPLEQTVTVEAKPVETPVFSLRRDPSINLSGDIPTVTLDEAEAETDGAGEVANLLHANRDIFQQQAGFGWSFFRFRERGYDSENFPVFLNGININDPETGIAFFGEFGGLNDVMRYRESSVGLDPTEFAFGGIGGASFIDTRASIQRKQIRASYAVSNRIYRNRVMLTASTGLMPGGWAVSISGSHRWAQEGYVPGTFFDGYSYFLSVDKKINPRHALNLTVLGAPNRRGRTADSFEEMFDISGTNYYNPLWGYQNGEKRNSQVQYNHQPIGILRYDWTPDRNTSIVTAVYAQGGRNSFTRLNWLNGANPAPDFNRRLPSSLIDTSQIDDWSDVLRRDEALRQIDWATLYTANRTNPFTVTNAEGIAGNTVSGNRSIYILEDQRSDSREAGANLIVRHTANDRVSFQGGLQYQWYQGKNFKVVEDLLGGDYWTDWDFFGQFEDPSAVNLGQQSDLQNINNVVYKGDKFGYDYDENIRRGQGWLQAQYNGRRIQTFGAFELGQLNYWRTGYMQNGRFPDNSLGDSDRLSWNTWAAKAGMVWKINGRNYVYANGNYGTRAPQFRDAFLSPRTRDQVAPNLELASIRAGEAGYILRSPYYRARITGYFSEFLNETENIFANVQSVSEVIEDIDFGAVFQDQGAAETFLQAPIFFGAAVLQNVNRRHMGIEAAIEAKPVPAWTITGAASVGNYIYTSRPDLSISLDYGNAPLLDAGLVYQENFYVPRTPQTTASIALRYESKRFWFATLTANYADNMWYDFDRLRRTTRFVEGLSTEAPVWNTIIDQKKAPAAYTLDFFGGKSWRVYEKYFIYLNVGVNNLLNNQNVVVSGRESYRNAFRVDISDPRFYANELLYAPGINYFISLAFRY